MDYLNISAITVLLIFTPYWIKTRRVENKLLYILFAAIPMFSSNFELSYFRLIFQTILVLVLLGNLIFWLKRGIRFSFVSVVFSTYMLFIIISYIDNSTNSNSFIAALINYVMIVSTVSYVFRKLYCKKEICALMNYFSYLSLIISIFAIFEKILIEGRTETTFSNSNYLAFFLGIGFLWILLKSKTNLKIYYLTIIGLAITSTGSRIVILSVVLLTSFYFLRSLKSKNFLRAIPLYLMLIIPIVYYFQDFGENRFGTEMAAGSDMERTAIMAISLNIMSQEPYTGIGYGQFIHKFSNYFPEGDIRVLVLYSRDQIVTHNDYLRIIVELGIPIFLLFVAYIIYVYIKAITYGNEIWYLFSYVLMFSVAHNNLNAFLFWFFLLLPIHYIKLNRVTKQIQTNENS